MPDPNGDRPGALARPLLLVAALTAWNYGSDVVSDRLHIETESFASPWKFPLIALGVAFSCGAVVGLGCVVWGKTSLRGLGWTFDAPRRLVLVGLAATAVIVGLVVAIYGVMGGRAGFVELWETMASLTIAQRVFFAVMGAKNAFVEETLFRGALQGSIERRWGRAAAVVGSSVVFALFHRTLDPVPLGMKLATGLIFALATSRTRSLVPSAMAHALMWAILANA